MIGLLKLSCSSWLNFDMLHVFRTCPFFKCFSICWHIVVHSVLLHFFWIYVESIFIFTLLLFCLFQPYPFFPWWAWPEDLYPLKIWLFTLLKSLFYIFPFWYILYIFLCWLWGLLIIYFIIFFGGSLGWLRFLVYFLERPLSIGTSFLGQHCPIDFM